MLSFYQTPEQKMHMESYAVKVGSWLPIFQDRFKIIESPECSCTNGNWTVDHLLYQCSKLNNEREKLIAYISKEDNWPVKKNELVNKYLKQFTNFTNSTDYGKM